MPLMGNYGIQPQMPPKQAANTNWAQGYKPNDPMNMFGTKANVSTAAPTLTGGAYGAPKTSMSVTRDLTGGIYTVPQAQESMNPSYDLTGGSYAPAPASMNVDYGTQAPGAGAGQGPAFQTQYATWDNIQPYMNPYLDQIINRGTNTIEHSAASKGLFGSSGNINDIGTWATNAQSKAYGDAVGMFNDDRNYMTDNYWKNRIADTSDFWNTYNANWDQYKYGNSDYLTRLLQSYSQNQGLVNTGIDSTNTTAAIYAALGDAIAKLQGNRGDVAMQGAVNNGNNNSGLIEGLIGLIPMLLGGGA